MIDLNFVHDDFNKYFVLITAISIFLGQVDKVVGLHGAVGQTDLQESIIVVDAIILPTFPFSLMLIMHMYPNLVKNKWH